MKFLFRIIVYAFIPLAVIGLVFVGPFLRDGLIVGSDWIFPYTRDQMIQMGKESLHLWSYREIPTGTQTPHQNIYLFTMAVGFLGQLGMNGVQFQRVFIFVVMSMMYLSFYICFA